MRRYRIPVLGFVAFVTLLVSHAPHAHALRYQEHPPWMVSFSLGYGRGGFTDPGGLESSWRNGAAPQIHVGRKITQRWMVNLSYEAWLIEYGNPPVKFRDTLQHFGLGFTFYPGQFQNASGGIYLRGSAGMGWAGFSDVEVFEDVALDHGHRVDQWGAGFGTGAGYDFWVSSNFQLGVGFTYAYFTINETLVDTGWFASTLLNFNLFF